MTDTHRRDDAFHACQRFLSGHGPRLVRPMLEALIAEVAAEERADFYGQGALVEAFEDELATLFGKPAAVFMPSGTMAQLIALRIACDRRTCATVAFHPTSHLALHEQGAYQHLHGLRARPVGDTDRPMVLSDLEAVDEPIAALLLELPQRELGGTLPAWCEVEAMAEWARAKGSALHLDGARIWETRPFYGLSYAAIAAPFDTVYVSFYKTLGGIAGAALLGDEDTMREARIWLRRHGGNLVSMYPFVLSARAGMRARLPRIEAYCQRARELASQFAAIEGVTVAPNPPPTNMMHVTFPFDGERLLNASAQIAERERIALFQRVRPGGTAGHCCAELSIGDAALALDSEEVRPLLIEMVQTAARLLPER
jgi:threonine aldolase